MLFRGESTPAADDEREDSVVEVVVVVVVENLHFIYFNVLPVF